MDTSVHTQTVRDIGSDMYNIFLKSMQYSYNISQMVYQRKFSLENVGWHEFINMLEQIMPRKLYPTGTSFPIVDMSTNIAAIQFASDNLPSQFISKNNKIKRKMISKLDEFKSRYHKTTGEFELNKNIFFNYAHYEIRDYIAETKNAEAVTNAWVKMYELISTMHMLQRSFVKQLNVFNTFHMCEMPGAFIIALNHYIKTYSNLQLNWTAQSLWDHSNKNMFGDYFGLYDKYKDHYDFGPTQTGDLYDLTNVNYYCEKYANKDMHMVTSDCGEGLDDNVHMKEDQMFKLQFNQFVIAVALKPQYYIAKLYSMYNINTQRLLYLATFFWKKVKIIRAYTTKITSDELYLSCYSPKIYEPDRWKWLISIDITKLSININVLHRLYLYNKYLYFKRSININSYLFILNNVKYIHAYNTQYPGAYFEWYFYNQTKCTRNYFIRSYVDIYLSIKPLDSKDKMLPNYKPKYTFKHDFSFERTTP
jgi:hypothetical protein